MLIQREALAGKARTLHPTVFSLLPCPLDCAACLPLHAGPGLKHTSVTSMPTPPLDSEARGSLGELPGRSLYHHAHDVHSLPPRRSSADIPFVGFPLP